MERRTSLHLRWLGATVAALAVAILGAVSLFHKIESFQPLGVTLLPAGGAWTVEAVATPATGLRPGDRVVLVGGESPASLTELRQRLRSQPETALTVLREPEAVVVTYRRPALDVDLPYLALAAAGALYLAIGLYVLLHGRHRPSGLFFLWCLASAAVYLLTWVPGSGGSALARGIFGVEELARVLLPPLTLHLFLAFPRPLLAGRPALRRLLPFLYLPAAVLGVLQADLIVNDGRWIFGGVSAGAVAALDRLALLHLALYSLLALALLAGRLLRHGEWEGRRQLQWVTVGLAAGYLPFCLFYVVPWMLAWRLPEWATAAAVLPLALVPLTFSWAILRYRLWDLEVILRNTLATTVTLLIGVLSFSLLNLAIARGLPDDERLAKSFLTFLSGIAIAGVLVPTHRGVRSLLERFQYGGTLGRRRALGELGRELLEERDPSRLAARLVGCLRDSLELGEVTLLLVAGNRLVPLLPGRDEAVPLEALDQAVWAAPVWRLAPQPLLATGADAVERLVRKGYRYAFPLTVRGRRVGVLLTGLREAGEPLNSEELDLVRSLLDQTALALENARLMEELRERLDEVTRLKHSTEQILESSPAGIALLDGEERVVSANRAFCALVGAPSESVEGELLAELLPVRPLPGPGDGLLETSYCDRDGRERYLQLSTAGYTHGAGELKVLVVHDVSERVEMQNSLKEQERMAALGMLAAGVAHEVNTPITGISSYAQMLLADTPPDDPRHQLLKKVERQTFRAAGIVNNLLELARNRRQEYQPVQLAPVLDDTLEALDDRLSRGTVEVRWQPPADPVWVRGSHPELTQVFANLIGNALDAMSAGGTLTLSLTAAYGVARAGVEDTGGGIPAAELERVFQPFYSTKLAAGGTGLGLSISFEIVQRHGGTLRVESEPGTGSRFLVELPLLPADGGGAP